jgi:hypothetical protein
MVQDWADITAQALQNLWQGTISFVPVLLGVIIVFVIGWFFAVLIGKIVTEILKKLKFNQIFEKGGWRAAMQKAEIKVDAAGFIGAIVKWVLIIAVLQVAVGILGWTDFAVLLGKVIDYLPNVIIAALIFVVAVVVADILQKVIVVAAESANFSYTRFAGTITKWAIWIFAVLAILRQLVIVPELVEILFSAIVYGVVATFVIAFGLGGRDMASEMLKELKGKLEE